MGREGKDGGLDVTVRSNTNLNVTGNLTWKASHAAWLEKEGTRPRMCLQVQEEEQEQEYFVP